MLSDDVETLATQINKVMELLRGFVAPVDDVHHVRSQDERSSVALEVAKHLKRKAVAKTLLT